MAVGGFAASGAALLVAWGSQVWLGLIPCAFCLLERWPYRIALGLAVLAVVLPRPPARVVLWLTVCVFLTGACVSLVHVGVEQHWWPDPIAACSVPNFSGMNAAERLAAMPARPAKSCEEPDFLLPGLRVSMTQMGLAYALVVSAGVTIGLLYGRQTHRQ